MHSAQRGIPKSHPIADTNPELSSGSGSRRLFPNEPPTLPDRRRGTTTSRAGAYRGGHGFRQRRRQPGGVRHGRVLPESEIGIVAGRRVNTLLGHPQFPCEVQNVLRPYKPLGSLEIPQHRQQGTGLFFHVNHDASRCKAGSIGGSGRVAGSNGFRDAERPEEMRCNHQGRLSRR
jgi:hypothetical protein